MSFERGVRHRFLARRIDTVAALARQLGRGTRAAFAFTVDALDQRLVGVKATVCSPQFCGLSLDRPPGWRAAFAFAVDAIDHC